MTLVHGICVSPAYDDECPLCGADDFSFMVKMRGVGRYVALHDEVAVARAILALEKQVHELRELIGVVE